MKVLLDSNFLRIPFQFGVDIFSEIERLLSTEPLYEISTISLVEEEIKRKALQNPTWNSVLELIKLKNVKVYPMEATDADSGLIGFAHPGDIICTQDKELKLLAKSNGIRVITMTNTSKLEAV